MKGTRRFSLDQSEWIIQQLRPHRHAPRTRELWHSLHMAFLAQFPPAPDAETVTRQQFKSHVVYIERKQDTSLVTRVQQQIKDHEERRRERHVLQSNHETEDDDVDDDEPEVEMRIKSEPVAALTRPLLRTKAPASAMANTVTATPTVAPVKSSSTNDVMVSPRKRKFGARRRTASDGVSSDSRTTTTSLSAYFESEARASAVSSAAAPPTKRPRVEPPPQTASVPASASRSVVAAQSSTAKATAKPTETKTTKTQLREAKRAAAQWKLKYETTNAMLTSERAMASVLQRRLDETLVALQSLEQRSLEHSGDAGGTTSGRQSHTFTITVNVDVSQNGERVQATNNTICVDANSGRASSTSNSSDRTVLS